MGNICFRAYVDEVGNFSFSELFHPDLYQLVNKRTPKVEDEQAITSRLWPLRTALYHELDDNLLLMQSRDSKAVYLIKLSELLKNLKFGIDNYKLNNTDRIHPRFAFIIKCDIECVLWTLAMRLRDEAGLEINPIEYAQAPPKEIDMNSTKSLYALNSEVKVETSPNKQTASITTSPKKAKPDKSTKKDFFKDYLKDGEKYKPYLLKHCTGFEPHDFAFLLKAFEKLGILYTQHLAIARPKHLHDALEYAFKNIGNVGSVQNLGNWTRQKLDDRKRRLDEYSVEQINIQKKAIMAFELDIAKKAN